MTGGQEAVSSSLATRTKKQEKFRFSTEFRNFSFAYFAQIWTGFFLYYISITYVLPYQKAFRSRCKSGFYWVFYDRRFLQHLAKPYRQAKKAQKRRDPFDSRL